MVHGTKDQSSTEARPRSVEGFLPGKKNGISAKGKGSLDGLRFAVKDNIDTAHSVTGAGNLYWANSHQAVANSAPVVDKLLHAGASLIGKTITEELAYSLIGDNKHFGVPINGATPNRFSGGSSSGSASVVSTGAVDFSLGTDTAGSIRVPASNCGLFGIRPTHQRVDMSGVVPLAQSFDTLGWLTRDINVLQSVSDVLLSPDSSESFKRYYFYSPAMRLVSEKYAGLFSRVVDQLDLQPAKSITEETLWPKQPEKMAETLRLLQAKEAWDNHGEWVSKLPKEALDEEIRARFYTGKAIDKDMLKVARETRRQLVDQFNELLAKYEVIAIPTVAEPALPIGSTKQQQRKYREKITQITCLSSLTGLPELTLPLVVQPDFRMGLSLIARKNSETALIDLARKLVKSIF